MMSIPRVLLVPTHHTGLADAVAATAAEIMTAKGQKVRYHHLGPIGPISCWDRWEGAAFLDPALYGEEALLGLYDYATRGATLSLLSSSCGLLDRQEGVSWLPADVARMLDCPIVVLIDCRGWSTGIRVLITGLKSHLADLNLAGAVLSGVSDQGHLALLKQVLIDEDVPVVGCLFDGDGPGWEDIAPGASSLPLEANLLDAVSRQVDINGLVSLAGQRGFLSSQGWLTDRGADGPVVAVAGGKGFTPWSRDSIEVLRSAGAQVRRLDLIEHTELPADTAGLVLAGTLWLTALPDIAMNTSLLRAIHERIGQGLPTIALGGGMLTLLNRVQDSLGRSSDLAGVVPAEGEILWDLQEPAYVELEAERDSVLLAKGESVVGWALTETEITELGAAWESPLIVRGGTRGGDLPEGAGSGSLLCSRVFVHLASRPEMASRFIRRCATYAVQHF
jgi:cobyrinic acid a,c-diamide synthase